MRRAAIKLRRAADYYRLPSNVLLIGLVDELQSYIGLKADTDNPVIITCIIGQKPRET